MSGETPITIVGNLTADPELRFTSSGAAVASLTIASTPRTFDKNSNEWKDGEALFMRATLWRQAAENAAETLTKGMRVIASGVLKQRSYEKDGQKRTVVEMEIEEIGPSLKYAVAKVAKAADKNGGQRQAQGQNQGRPQQQARQTAGAAQGSDPWATGGSYSDNPPF